jgi:hypothetical protein
MNKAISGRFEMKNLTLEILEVSDASHSGRFRAFKRCFKTIGSKVFIAT